MIRKPWWKILTVLLLLTTFIGGFLVKVPRVGNLYETIRNLFFHVPMWFGMMGMLGVSVIYAIIYLSKPSAKNDIYSALESAKNLLNKYKKITLVFPKIIPYPKEIITGFRSYCLNNKFQRQTERNHKTKWNPK